MPKNSFIVDAGANIGLFSIYMKKKYPQSTVLAFEPALMTFELLQKNLKLHNMIGVDAHQCGLGLTNRTATFTFYPLFSGNSTFAPEEKENISRSFFTKKLGKQKAEDMMAGQEIPVSIHPLSQFLDGYPDLHTIDLLKVDVEGTEIDVLDSLSEKQWAMIKNISMEISAWDNNYAKAKALLKSKGFVITFTITEWGMDCEKCFYLVTARRPSIQDQNDGLYLVPDLA